AERERAAHLLFLENLDRVNRALRGSDNLEQAVSDVLDTLLDIFGCDRAFLVYPCDPEAPRWRVPLERTRTEYPGAFTVGLDLPVDPEVSRVMRALMATNGAVPFGPGTEHPLPDTAATEFGIQSMITMAVYPTVDKPYMFGLHQCSHPR